MSDAPAGAWAPLRERAFALIWFAAVVSNIGTWMHDVAAAWLMTTLAPEPLMVALVQAATSLPIFMFALPAGALADLIDRRRLLLGLQVCAGVPRRRPGACVVAAGAITPGLLLLFTFLLGTTAALGAPAWQAMTPDLVPKPLLAQAVALNGVGINIARAIGPALGGLVITAAGHRLAVRPQRAELRRRDPGLVALAPRGPARLGPARRALPRPPSARACATPAAARTCAPRWSARPASSCSAARCGRSCR